MAKVNRASIQSRRLTLTIVFASMYTLGTAALAPISFGIVQFRVTDALIPLSVLFGYPTVAGVTLGCLVGNAYMGLSWIDVVFGSIANLVASTLAFRLRKKPFLACTASTLTVTGIVGSYLWTLFQVPWEISLLGVFAGSLLSINVVGYSLIKGLEKSGALKKYNMLWD